MAALPVVVVIVAVVVVLIILGSRAEEAQRTASGPPSTVVAAASAGGALVAIQQEDALPALVLLAREDKGGIALGMPGMTLIKTAEGFKTLAQLYHAEQTEALLAGLNSDLDTVAEDLAGVRWGDLLAALEKAGSAESWPATIDGGPEGAQEAAGALLAIIAVSASTPGSEAWEGLNVSGRGEWLRSFVAAIAPGAAEGTWSAAVLPGKVTESIDLTFYEPDVASAKTLLGGNTENAGAVTLEVQNGSGALDGAQAAGAILASLGYTMAPFVNADGFPDVAKTTIAAAPDVLAEARKVKDLLGVGTVREDGSLASGHIQVVLGKDFEPEDPDS